MKHDVIMLSIADISPIIRLIESQYGQRDLDSPYNFGGHIKYHVTLKVTLTFRVNCKENEYSSFIVWFLPS